VALDKTSFQSRSSGGNASLINDGNKGTCQLSNRETNPWWAVDLGVKTAVHQINFTNSRISNSGDYVPDTPPPEKLFTQFMHIYVISA